MDIPKNLAFNGPNPCLSGPPAERAGRQGSPFSLPVRAGKREGYKEFLEMPL